MSRKTDGILSNTMLQSIRIPVPKIRINYLIYQGQLCRSLCSASAT